MGEVQRTLFDHEALDDGWTEDERQRRDAMLRGLTVVVNQRADERLIRWARLEGLLVKVDRKTRWGNPFKIPDDGDRDAVCDRFAARLRGKPDLLKKIPTLKGKALACWCHPERCHAHHLARLANGEGGAAPIARLSPLATAPPDHVALERWNGMTPEAKQASLVPSPGSTKEFNPQSGESIEWALWSWNPVTGCLHDCPYCYARDIATVGRAAGAFPNGFEPTFLPERLAAPANTTVPAAKAAEWMGHRNVFVCSMADLFGRWVPREWIDAVLAAAREAPQWNFLFLTKFPARMAEFDFPANAWAGTSVDQQARVRNAEKAMRNVNAAVKWLSCEPLIEPLRFEDIGAFDWVVLGGATSSTRTPAWHPPRAWVNEIEAQAAAAGVRVYEKSNLWQRVRQYPGEDIIPEPGQAPESLRYLPPASQGYEGEAGGAHHERGRPDR